MNSIPYIIHSNSQGKHLQHVDPNNTPYQEGWLQELIRVHPDILPTTDIEQVFSPLIPIGREVPVASGYIDNLFISPQGYLVIVETKLWRNPEARRDALSQLIDYAACISNWTYDDVDKVTRKYTHQYEKKEMGLFALVGSKFDLEDRFFFEEAVSRNLRLGRLLMLLVGDQIRSSVVDMLSFVNKYPHLAINIALVELKCYRINDTQEWPVLVIPSLLAKTEIVERTIVEVSLLADGSPKIKATQEKLKEKSGKIRSPLSEENYWESLKNQSPESVDPARKLIEYYREKAGISIRPRENSIAVHLFPPEADQKISLFFIRMDGVIECWIPKIAEQLKKNGIDTHLLDAYDKGLSTFLKKRTKALSINYPLLKVDVDGLILVVDRFIEQILLAEPKRDSE